MIWLPEQPAHHLPAGQSGYTIRHHIGYDSRSPDAPIQATTYAMASVVKESFDGR